MYRFVSASKEWKEKGIGDIKLLRHKETGKVRVLMRRDKIYKLAANHYSKCSLSFVTRAQVS